MERISNALAIVRRLEQEGYEAAIVGGAVRDLFLGRAELSDADVATGASLGAIRSLWGERVKVTRKGPPWTAVIPMDGFNVEVTPFFG
jgi:poly(A) polymerase